MTNLEKHLAEHWLSGVQPDDWAYFCECGEKLADNDEDVDLDQVQRAHVAATWREARTVRTVEELDALDGGVVVMLLHSTGEPHGARMNADHTMCRKWIETGLALLIIWDPEGGAL